LIFDHNRQTNVTNTERKETNHTSEILITFIVLDYPEAVSCYNNIEGNITECSLVNEESIFFLNFAL